MPNLIRNGTLAALLRERPQLKTLFLHNIDTTGADLDPTLLGQHLNSGATLTFEVITRRLKIAAAGLLAWMVVCASLKALRCRARRLNSPCAITIL
jgi:UDP-N-acetylglucosamine pyrophosphorylase